jgi:sulfur carrier protein ThiS adenylyltransferase
MTFEHNDADRIGKKLKDGKVAVAGLGGLGSNIAIMLARAGVGKLLLVDFDRVEKSNLNRQHYDMSHLGILKTDALRDQIKRIDPTIDVETYAGRVTEENASEIFGEYQIVCEAFDDPRCKAMLVNALLNGQRKIVAASGMSGYGNANKIKTKHVFKDMYICGDPESTTETVFTAPRVSVCAGHQANTVLRLLLNIEDE